MSALQEEAHKLRRDSRPPSTRATYSIAIDVGSGAITLNLREAPHQGVLHSWGKAKDPALDAHADLLGLLEIALEDLDKALKAHRIRIRDVDVNRGHIPLFNAGGLLTRNLVQRRGEHYMYLRPGGNLDEDMAGFELLEFDRVTVHCETANLL